jgi:hypothetical protein
VQPRLLLTLLLSTACTSPRPAGPVVAISGPTVGAHTGQPVTADVYPLRGNRPRRPVARGAVQRELGL